jgi:hypothetical protein
MIGPDSQITARIGSFPEELSLDFVSFVANGPQKSAHFFEDGERDFFPGSGTTPHAVA